ncbi:MAG: fatty acid desaturase [Myxococcota bacterium]
MSTSRQLTSATGRRRVSPRPLSDPRNPSRGRGWGPLRYRADLRTLAFMAFITGLLIYNWQQDAPQAWSVALACLMGVSISAMIHNHLHLSMWRARWLNVLTDYWLVVFTGSTIFEWIPAHMRSHHTHHNRPGDYFTTFQARDRNDLLGMALFALGATLSHKGPVFRYLQELWQTRRKHFMYCMTQVLVVVLSHAGLFYLSVEKTLYYFILPHLATLASLLLIGYIQHVDADEKDAFNHARNFTGWGVNFFLMNNGLHTVHHHRAGLHWSDLPVAHAAIEGRIDPRLNEESMLWYLVRTYLLGLLHPRFRSVSLRRTKPGGGRPERSPSIRPLSPPSGAPQAGLLS